MIDFRRLVLGQSVSTLGSQMQQVAVAWQLWSLSHDTLVMGLLGLARALPVLLLAPWGGHCADRFDRRRLMLTTQGIMAGVALAFNVSFTLFSGTAPLIATSLIEKTGNNASPAYMMMAGALIALVGSIWVTRYGGNVMQEA